MSCSPENEPTLVQNDPFVLGDDIAGEVFRVEGPTSQTSHPATARLANGRVLPDGRPLNAALKIYTRVQAKQRRKAATQTLLHEGVVLPDTAISGLYCKNAETPNNNACLICTTAQRPEAFR